MMNFSTITVLIFLVYYLWRISIFSGYKEELRYKYKAHTWHHGFFADLKLKKMLNEEDKKEFKAKARKLDKLLMWFLIYTILIFAISGIFLNGKL